MRKSLKRTLKIVSQKKRRSCVYLLGRQYLVKTYEAPRSTLNAHRAVERANENPVENAYDAKRYRGAREHVLSSNKKTRRDQLAASRSAHVLVDLQQARQRPAVRARRGLAPQALARAAEDLRSEVNNSQ